MDVLQGIHETFLEYNLSKLFFILSILLITVLGCLINFLEEAPLPHFVIQTFKFGKAAHKTHLNKIVSCMEVPKRWFLHFYIFSSLISTVALVEMYRIYVNGNSLSPWFCVLLDVLTLSDRTASVDATTSVVALVVWALHVYRRLYECLFVSVFSAAKMNLTHYLLGFGHYLCLLALLLAELPGFDGKGSPTTFSRVEVHHIAGVVMCVLSFIFQHQTFNILANLRKKQGKSGKAQHVLPEGGLFCLVSCPHMLAEIGIYIGMMLVLGSHFFWPLVTLWVVCNQVQIALMNQKWYQDTFKDYPKKRKAIFPYLL